MSFSAQVKTELCKAPISRKCCAVSEAFGVLLTCNAFSPRQLRIVTEHGDFAARLPKLFRRAFNLEFDEAPRTVPESGKYIFSIQQTAKLKSVFDAFDLPTEGNAAVYLNRGILEQECCEIAFLRGAFLCGGSVTDPEKRYHLELTSTHSRVMPEVFSLLLDLGFLPRDTVRNGICMVYFKQSDQIEDILTAIGAPICAMSIMEAKVEKNLRNDINRRCNCDSGNVSKAVNAAQEQIAAIRRLRENGTFDRLPEQIRQTAEYRENDPTATLTEIAAAFGVTKSAVNHRMRKIMELSRG